MKTITKVLKNMMLLAAFGVVLNSCKKDKHIPPTVTLKTGVGYTATDVSVGKMVIIKVGIIADKVEDDMQTYNVSYAYDGATTTTTSQTFTLAGAELQHYDKDVTFTTRNVAGSEKWIFTITDKDGNIAQKQIVLTVL